MPNHQRARAPQWATIYRAIPVEDHRGNTTVQPTYDSPHQVRASVVPDRSARAEVPGEMEIDVITLRVPPDLADVNLRSRVLWDGDAWDLVAPPSDRVGTRHTRHTTLTMRKRPGGLGIYV